MKIAALQKFTLIDYPGKLACTIFVAGCNFLCPFCHNSELVLSENMKSLDLIEDEEVFDFLQERKRFLEGTCITGGEPTIYPDLPDFIRKIKDIGYLVKLDTNGGNPEMLEKLINEGLLDYVAMDIKAPKGRYSEVIGKEINEDLIDRSISLLKNSSIDYEFRTTVVPELLTKKDVLSIVQWIKGAKKYYLQKFLPQKTINPYFENLKPYPDEYLLEIQKAAAPFFDVCQVRNL
jgi:pyruvate formate lyase activating enzyme